MAFIPNVCKCMVVEAIVWEGGVWPLMAPGIHTNPCTQSSARALNTMHTINPARMCMENGTSIAARFKNKLKKNVRWADCVKPAVCLESRDEWMFRQPEPVEVVEATQKKRRKRKKKNENAEEEDDWEVSIWIGAEMEPVFRMVHIGDVDEDLDVLRELHMNSHAHVHGLDDFAEDDVEMEIEKLRVRTDVCRTPQQKKAGSRHKLCATPSTASFSETGEQEEDDEIIMC